MINGWILESCSTINDSRKAAKMFEVTLTWRHLETGTRSTDVVWCKDFSMFRQIIAEQKQFYGEERQGGMTTQEGASG